MAKTKAKSIDKKSSLLSANDDKYLIADNSTLPILNDTHFNDVAASNQQATTRNPFAINPGGGGIRDVEFRHVDYPSQPTNGIYYRYSIQADGLDISGQVLGPQSVNGYLSFFDASNNITASLRLYSVEYAPIPDYLNNYTEDEFSNLWLTDYGQWIYKVTTDDGIDMTITMNQVGFATHLVSLDYQINRNGDPLGTLPDFGTPLLVSLSVEDVEAYFGIEWTPTTVTNALGSTTDYMVHNTVGYNGVLITKFNAIVYGNDNSEGIGGSRYNDIIYGEGGNDSLFGMSGDDTIYGGDGDDYIIGGAGDDLLNAGDGNDYIVSGTGNDVINGGLGDDRFVLYSHIANVEGADTITGGGADEFIFTIENLPFDTFTITDFQHGQDTIQIYNNYYSQNANNENIVQGIIPVAQDWNDYFLFDTQNGHLYLDVDGVNGVDAVLIAKLIGVTSISGADFS